jgi:hypothetical protein
VEEMNTPNASGQGNDRELCRVVDVRKRPHRLIVLCFHDQTGAAAFEGRSQSLPVTQRLT